MKRFLGLAIGLFSVIGFTSWAEAITITIAEVQNGLAVVRGNKAAKSAVITWDGLSITQTNNGGSFSFSGTVPADCVGTLSDGVSTIDVVVLDCAPGSKAPNGIVNGGFETGDLTGWETIGDVSVHQTSTFGASGVIPTQGNFQVLMTTAPNYPPYLYINPDNQVPFSGSDAVEFGLITLFDASPSGGSIALYIGLTQAGEFEQSGIKQSFTTAVPGVLMFRWNFLTDEANQTYDAAVFILDDMVLSLIPDYPYLPWIGGRPASISPSPTIFLRETGYQMVVVQVGPGTHIFGFGVGDNADRWVTSGLLVDNIVFRPGGAGTN